MTANSYDFAGKTVLVTGGGTGIGRAIAEAFLANGANVAISGRRRETLEEALAGHPAERTLAVQADVGDDESAAAMVAAVVERFGSLDVVVNNAAAYDERAVRRARPRRLGGDPRAPTSTGSSTSPATPCPSWRAAAATWSSSGRSRACAATGARRPTTPPRPRS